MKSRINYYPQFPEAFLKLSEIELLIKKSTVDKHLLHLVKLRASQINKCNFCVDLHVKEAKIDQEKELRLHHLITWEESSLFTDKEKAALRWTEVLTKLSETHISDELFLATREHFTEKELVDLTMVISMINTWNRFGVAFRSVAGSMDKALGVDNSGL